MTSTTPTTTNAAAMADAAALTPADLTALAATLADLRADATVNVGDKLAAGDHVVACMSASGKVMTKAFDTWHAKADGNLFGLGYAVKDGASDYQRRGAVCGYQRSYAAALADFDKLAGRNGSQVMQPGSQVVVPGYVVARADLPALTRVLTLAYAAWLLAADKPAPKQRSRAKAAPAKAAPRRSRAKAAAK